nr:response regulator [Deinococcus yavapaiensis]
MRVVLVEDDLRVARVNRDLLEADPEVHVLGTATSVAEGDQLVRHLRPDLVLLDVYLPDGTGLDLLRSWRARGEVFDVLMVTAADDAGVVQSALSHGAFDYLIKPFDRSRLGDALARFRRRKALTGATFDQASLDRYLGVASAAPLPKGVDARTLERVADLLTRHPDGLSAEDVGGLVGLSRPTAWRYLEHLVGTGRARLDYQYGAGRPSKRYKAHGARNNEDSGARS